MGKSLLQIRLGGTLKKGGSGMSGMKSVERVLPLLLAVTLAGTLGGCANYEVNTMRGNVPGYYIRTEMQEADRAVEAARTAGKDKLCPAEFKAAEDAKNNAYDVFRACNTEPGAALAKAATAKANALCPPPPAPIVVAPPAIVPPAAPTASLTVTPESVTKGQAATLNWKSQNASGCDIQPDIGPLPPQGVREITPAASTSYSLACTGDGGTATSAAGVTVVLPPPVPVAAVERFCNKPSIIVVEFDTDKSNIKTKYDGDLNILGTFLKEWPQAKGEISGHTDNVGSDKYNLSLSQRRAASVKKYLVEKFNIAPERLTTEGYGESKPIASNKTKDGRQQNRRIETNFTCK
jgi:OOP family OmpA-OmpF porin